MASEYIDMEEAEAIAAKFAAGRERYGNGWKGEHPLIEAHAEVLDLLVYLKLSGGLVSDMTRNFASAARWALKMDIEAARKAGVDLTGFGLPAEGE